MDLNMAMRFVMVRAQAEAIASNMDIYPEHIFLGLLKLSEMTAEEIAPGDMYKQEMDEDIKQVAALLKSNGIYSKEAREKLRRILRNETPAGSSEAAISELFAKVARLNEEYTVRSIHVLSVFLKEPTHILAAIFHINVLI